MLFDACAFAGQLSDWVDLSDGAYFNRQISACQTLFEEFLR